MKQIYRLLLLLWCCVSALHAETKVDAIHLLTKDDGMAGETVSRVIMDKYGRAVVATNDGISIYMVSVLQHSRCAGMLICLIMYMMSV